MDPILYRAAQKRVGARRFAIRATEIRIAYVNADPSFQCLPDTHRIPPQALRVQFLLWLLFLLLIYFSPFMELGGI